MQVPVDKNRKSMVFQPRMEYLRHVAKEESCDFVHECVLNLMPAVHSCRENPRQRESENVDWNTRLRCSRVTSGARVSPRQLSLF